MNATNRTALGPGSSAPVDGAQYGSSVACYHCYIKHLSKASVQADEVFESDGREHELSLCLGNVACAEDHASALGLSSDRERLRGLRDRIWYGDAKASRDLLDMAVSAIRTMRAIERTQAQQPVPHSTAGGNVDAGPDGGSNDEGA